METHLITQSSLDEVGLQLDNLGDDLVAHADGSLSEAHSINVLHYTVPTVDAYGNDVRYYNNSTGQKISDYQVRFTVDGVVYYAPARITTLAAQPPTESLTADQSEEVLNGRGSTALATQFRTETVDGLTAIRTDVLLPHTHMGHWEAHAPVRVIPRLHLDSAGHVVGRASLIWQFNGAKFEIPCDPHIGGPPEPPRNASISPEKIDLVYPPKAGYPQIKAISLVATAEGYRPFTFMWELMTTTDPILGDTWSPLTNADGSSAGEQTSYDNRLRVSGHGETLNDPGKGAFVIETLETETGGNQGSIRCIISNSVGSVIVSIPVKIVNQ